MTMANKAKNKAASAAARQRAAELAASEKRKSALVVTFTVVGALLAVALIVWAVMFIMGSKPGQVAGLDVELYDSGVVTVPSSADETGGFVVGMTGIVGQDLPAEGTVRVDIYEDFMCPNCATLERVTHFDIEELREQGLITVAYHPISILNRFSEGTAYPTRAAQALATVAEYDPEHFDEFSLQLFGNQPAENTIGLTNTEIDNFARAAGVSEEAILKIRDGEFTRWVAQATEASSIAGVRGTPTILFDGAPVSPEWWVEGQLRAAIEDFIDFKALDDALEEDAA